MAIYQPTAPRGPDKTAHPPPIGSGDSISAAEPVAAAPPAVGPVSGSPVGPWKKGHRGHAAGHNPAPVYPHPVRHHAAVGPGHPVPNGPRRR